MRRSVLACFVVLGSAGVALAQTSPADVRVEVSGSVGWGQLSRFDDSTPFGGGITLGGRVDIRPIERLGTGVDVHGMSGLDESVRSAVAMSAHATYDLSAGGRATPYALAGLAMLHTNHRASRTNPSDVAGDHADNGWGPIVGLGARVPLTPRISLRPELSHSTVLWGSRANLSETRASVALGYQW